ncbi:MAG: DUF4325 domain-containing protein [Thaumarchaeota archaeon]|nr:DUF4325 domain-containing protein [Nitrososphaerota archaeon]
MADAIAPNLMLRGVADAFLDRLEKTDSKVIVLDFDGVQSISRSFAHQYTVRKKKTSKEIKETNLPENVSKMLEIVERSLPSSKPRPLLSSLKDAKVITV